MTWFLLAVALAFVVFVVLAYTMKWRWTGLPEVKGGEHGSEVARPPKTLWDWLQLFVIPLALAGLAFLLNNAQARRDQSREDQRAAEQRLVAEDDAREEALRAYLTQLSELMLDRRLLRSEENADVRHVARTATLTALRRLDGERRGLVVRFLFEAQLLDRNDSKVELQDADLRNVKLRGADLVGAELRDVDLRGADLQEARLASSDLRGADLRGADLANADVAGTDLKGADLGRSGTRPPGVPAAKASIRALEGLRVAPRGSLAGYTRASFGFPAPTRDGCDTRNHVLRRDGRMVHTASGCRITGSWISPYDGVLLTSAKEVDVDQVVPLRHAWSTGAKSWTPAQRNAFANDMRNPQLIATSAPSNRAKGDRAPDEWMPPREGIWCVYARWWVDVKTVWRLTITVAERSALRETLQLYCR